MTDGTTCACPPCWRSRGKDKAHVDNPEQKTTHSKESGAQKRKEGRTDNFLTPDSRDDDPFGDDVSSKDSEPNSMGASAQILLAASSDLWKRGKLRYRPVLFFSCKVAGMSLMGSHAGLSIDITPSNRNRKGKR